MRCRSCCAPAAADRPPGWISPSPIVKAPYGRTQPPSEPVARSRPLLAKRDTGPGGRLLPPACAVTRPFPARPGQTVSHPGGPPPNHQACRRPSRDESWSGIELRSRGCGDRVHFIPVHGRPPILPPAVTQNDALKPWLWTMGIGFCTEFPPWSKCDGGDSRREWPSGAELRHFPPVQRPKTRWWRSRICASYCSTETAVLGSCVPSPGATVWC